MMYFIMALDALGYPQDHPDLVEAIRHFESLLIETEDRFIFQPCVSPIWDTAICAFALGEAGVGRRRADDARGRLAASAKKCGARATGPSSGRTPSLPAGPSNSPTSSTPISTTPPWCCWRCCTPRRPNPQAQAAAERRAINWLLAMQSEDGGWAAFDVDNNWAVLNQVPFADHNAMLDPTCPDITGRVVECLCRRGMAGHEAVRRGVAYLLQAQEKDGSWYGRWGVNYIYGSFLAMRGLAASGRRGRRMRSRRAARWLRSIQNPDGGWGESCASYDRDRFVAAPSCAVANRLGAAGSASGRRARIGCRRSGEYSSCWTASGRTARGPKTPPRAPAFPMSSI